MTPSMTSDLAYLKDLAEAGQNAPLLGGRFLAWWGGLASVAYVGHFLIASGFAGLEPVALAYMWSGFMLLGLGGQVMMARTFPASKPGAASLGNKVSQTVWMAGGMALFSFFAGVVLKSVFEGQASIGFIWSVPVVLAVYGLCQLTAGLLANARPLILAGWGAIIGVGVAAVFSGSNAIWIVGAVTAALTVFLPGLLLMRGEPAETV
ncbi:MAG: hypothetical protein ACRBEQ_13740 [Hyphomonas sp.]